MAGVLTKTGVVKSVEGRMALVKTTLEAECEGCGARGACTATGGTGANVEVMARNTVKAEIGDVVTISMKGSSLLKVSFMIYMLPILALIGGVILGVQLSKVISVDEDILVGLFGLLAFSGVFIWIKKKSEKLSQKKEFIPEIVSKLGNKQCK